MRKKFQAVRRIEDNGEGGFSDEERVSREWGRERKMLQRGEVMKGNRVLLVSEKMMGSCSCWLGHLCQIAAEGYVGGGPTSGV